MSISREEKDQLTERIIEIRELAISANSTLSQYPAYINERIASPNHIKIDDIITHKAAYGFLKHMEIAVSVAHEQLKKQPELNQEGQKTVAELENQRRQLKLAASQLRRAYSTRHELPTSGEIAEAIETLKKISDEKTPSAAEAIKLYYSDAVLILERLSKDRDRAEDTKLFD
jgi:DNA integrity scanning protein DisA with diadenylate cyclase activity